MSCPHMDGNGCMACWLTNHPGIPVSSDRRYIMGHGDGRTEERAAIVAWLRGEYAGSESCAGKARLIEIGVHLQPPGIAAEPPGICGRPPGNGAECPRCELSEDDHKYAANPNIIAPGSTPSADITPYDECGNMGGTWCALPKGHAGGHCTVLGEWPSAEPDRPDGEE